MKKRKIRKAFRHKWIEHVVYKYKYVETENSYREYEAFRVWFVIFAWVLTIIASPILTLIALVSEAKSWFCFPTGKDGHEKFTVMSKEEVEK